MNSHNHGESEEQGQFAVELELGSGLLNQGEIFFVDWGVHGPERNSLFKKKHSSAVLRR